MARLLLSTGVDCNSLSSGMQEPCYYTPVHQESGRPVRGAMAPLPPVHTHAKVSYTPGSGSSGVVCRPRRNELLYNVYNIVHVQ